MHVNADTNTGIVWDKFFRSLSRWHRARLESRGSESARHSWTRASEREIATGIVLSVSVVLAWQHRSRSTRLKRLQAWPSRDAGAQDAARLYLSTRSAFPSATPGSRAVPTISSIPTPDADDHVRVRLFVARSEVADPCGLEKVGRKNGAHSATGILVLRAVVSKVAKPGQKISSCALRSWYSRSSGAGSSAPSSASMFKMPFERSGQ